MGWVICVVMFVCWCIMKESYLLIASSVFAIAGSIAELAAAIRKNK